MTYLAAEPALLLSVFKPIVMFVVLVGWAWLAAFFDKDIRGHYLNYKLWNSVQLGAGAAAFGLWLLIPFFWLGLVLALLILGGAAGGYAFYRNTKVSAGERWDFSLDSFRQRLDAREQAMAQEEANLRLLHRDGSAMEVPVGDEPPAKAHEALERAVGFMLARAGERIELAATAEQAQFAVYVDGVRYDMPPIDSRLALTLIDYVKGAAGMDLADRRRKQQAMQAIDAGDFGRHTLGVTTFGSTREMNLSLVLDPEKRTVMPLDKLGFLPQQRQQIEPLFDDAKYAVIVACPPHQGQTTTLYSLLSRHDPYTHGIMTLEERVAIDLEGVTHETIEPGLDPATLSKKVASLLRKGPEIIMLERVSDAQVARVVAEAAPELRIYFGLNQNDTFTALKVWAKAVNDLKIAAAGLGAIVSQRLVRKLCTTCRVPYQPDPDALRKMNLPAGKVTQLYKHSGQVLIRDKAQPCPDCMGIGYRGRIGVFEVMVLDDTARSLLAEGQLDPLRAHLRKNKMLWMQEAALARVVEGVTSISEVTRAMAGK